jgi:hypothetical protein
MILSDPDVSRVILMHSKLFSSWAKFSPGGFALEGRIDGFKVSFGGQLIHPTHPSVFLATLPPPRRL